MSVYTCPMHPMETSKEQAVCGICGMNLEATDLSETEANSDNSASVTPDSEAA